MANPVQWTADQLTAELERIQAQAQAEWTALGQNSATMAELYARTTDPAARAKLEALANRQVRLQAMFNTAYGKFKDGWNGAARWLQSAGLTVPDNPGLAGLAGPELLLVPVVVIGAVTVATLFFAAFHEYNANQKQALDMVTAGTWTADQATAWANAKDKGIIPDPFKGLEGALIPALAIVALIVLGPTLVRLIPKRAAA